MINIDRKYLCKKNSYYCIKGSRYYIHSISMNRVSIHVDNYHVYEKFVFENGYYIDFNFYEYFYTEQEERKLKLEQLNNVKYK